MPKPDAFEMISCSRLPGHAKMTVKNCAARFSKASGDGKKAAVVPLLDNTPHKFWQEGPREAKDLSLDCCRNCPEGAMRVLQLKSDGGSTSDQIPRKRRGRPPGSQTKLAEVLPLTSPPPLHPEPPPEQHPRCSFLGCNELCAETDSMVLSYCQTHQTPLARYRALLDVLHRTDINTATYGNGVTAKRRRLELYAASEIAHGLSFGDSLPHPSELPFDYLMLCFRHVCDHLGLSLILGEKLTNGETET